MHNSLNDIENPREELANTLTHALGAVLSLVGLYYLLVRTVSLAEGTSIDYFQLASVTVFGLSLIALYGASTLYHAARCPDKKNTFKMWDHCAIYLLIAGTYTPFLLVSMRDLVGWQFIVTIWGIALAGIIMKLAFKHRFKLLRVATYVLMGWLVVLSLEELKTAISATGLSLLVAGGLIYTLGVFFYLNERIPYSHAIWHFFVMAGSVCHYFSIYYGVLAEPGLSV